MKRTHVSTEPAILYFGTPVVLISTLNEDGSANLAPMSSAFWLGWRCMLGLGAGSKTALNILRTGECVLNLASASEAAAVNRLALLTGADPVPLPKIDRGYTHQKNKFEIAQLTEQASETVAPPRVLECPVQMEAVLAQTNAIMEDLPAMQGRIKVFEVRVTRVHVDELLMMKHRPNHVDPDKWQPLIMTFSKLYSVAPGQVLHSTLGDIEEAKYRTPDVDRARAARLGG